MKLDYFLKKEKINRILSYAEIKDGNKIYFGWKESNTLDLNTKLVISKKKVDDSVKIEVATLSDYEAYFKASTSETPASFLVKWESADDKALKNFLKSNKQLYLNGEESFWIKMANLILNEKGFNKFGISYKILDLE
jgi:hypothetical protein